ncbi:MAG: SDR family oxidoreductase [Alphaproteobacteria bacterium]|nr:SDR family oxidoreductase [Alphaproteobacteria bacterium]
MKSFFSQKECQNKSWLLTGVAGFIGSNLLEFLLKNDQTVIGLDNFLTGKRENLKSVLEKLSPQQIKSFTLVEGDIRDDKLCHEVSKNVDYVLHQAALGSVPRSLKDPQTTNDVNVTGFLNILRASQENKVSKFVYASSSSVYGDSPHLPKVEEQIGNPLSPYAVSKRTNELYGEVFTHCYGIPTIGLRYFNVFGPRQDPESMYAALIPLWVTALLKGKPCYINGDGFNSRDFCYVENAIEANLKAAVTQNREAFGTVFNVAYGAQTNLHEVYALIKTYLEIQGEIQPLYREERPGDVKHSLANIDKAKALLGYCPSYSFKEGLKYTVEWFKKSYQDKLSQ